MIQRKQTIYLFLATIVCAICLFMQIGSYEPATMGAGYRLYNLYTANADQNTLSFRSAPLFLLLATAMLLSCVTFFLFRNRRVVMLLCTIIKVVLLLWNIAALLYAYLFGYEACTFHFTWAACLPAVAFFLVWLARRGVVADEKLVRAADRIR